MSIQTGEGADQGCLLQSSAVMLRIPLNSATHSEGKLPPEHPMQVAERDCTQLAGLTQASACGSLALEARIDLPERAMRIA